ncbi:uncharacterized protein THITE_2126257 [Thermothielavioides terrestris NRRL 8126]|uniref:Uncharacterized protein n=1 Tax=Thermothielavioides terrestris (strain ATCC 38088 / NRRL 8126) TaxID=578455 RepID=G2QVC4_THETT|nr:uncharacterized protein THITE_2126257 [Thermothielavioides terrestris NRRL 8126]AEO63811.1 hypothetical protein THITE_2126257 [Thermothielavioides terrestris NRRL 8126]
MKSTNIISAAVATHGVVNAAALPIPPDETAKQDSTVEEFDNPAWWGKEKRDLTPYMIGRRSTAAGWSKIVVEHKIIALFARLAIDVGTIEKDLKGDVVSAAKANFVCTVQGMSFCTPETPIDPARDNNPASDEAPALSIAYEKRLSQRARR